jgi:hypothetical protein
MRQTAIHAAQSLVPETSAFEAEMTIENLKRHKSLDIDKVQQNLLKQQVWELILRSVNLLILFG